jgi:hypothetical protein
MARLPALLSLALLSSSALAFGLPDVAYAEGEAAVAPSKTQIQVLASGQDKDGNHAVLVEVGGALKVAFFGKAGAMQRFDGDLLQDVNGIVVDPPGQMTMLTFTRDGRVLGRSPSGFTSTLTPSFGPAAPSALGEVERSVNQMVDAARTRVNAQAAATAPTRVASATLELSSTTPAGETPTNPLARGLTSYKPSSWRVVQWAKALRARKQQQQRPHAATRAKH